MKWKEGRQKDFKYYKLKLWSFKIFNRGFDCYILKYPEKGWLPEHRDVIPNGEHHRINIRLSGSSLFFIENEHDYILDYRKKKNNKI